MIIAMEHHIKIAKHRRQCRGFVAAACLTTLVLFPAAGTGKAVGVPESSPIPEYHIVPGGSGIPEPYPALHGGSFSGGQVKLSPDPLAAYRWLHTPASAGLQTYVLRPTAVYSPTPQSFRGLETATKRKCDITVTGPGLIRVDFGVESAAWMEFDSPDCTGSGVKIGVSEFDAPAHEASSIGKPERIGHTFRARLNAQFYEGVRFGWIYVRRFSGKPWHITAIRAVCQIKPTNYNGSFSCSNPMLTRIWYTGAYTVKLNLLHQGIGAILMDRGDRISWVGDAHIAQSTAMTAFGDFDFVRHNLNASAGKGNGIASYYLYWVLSLVDYYRCSGDTAEIRKYYPLVQKLLRHAAANFSHPHIAFYGWDDRLGGFAGAENSISREAYRMLFIETCRRFAQAAGSAGNQALQSKYAAWADRYTTLIQYNKRWIREADLFSAADAINAGVPTAEQTRLLSRLDFSDRLNRISFSPFNEYFVIKAMARAHLWNEALETTLDDWGGQINYGGTTFFEVYEPGWNRVIPPNGGIPSTICGPTSLCHPWSSGCTTWLTQWTAGIQPAAPGYRQVNIMPHLGAMLTWVRASVPTPHGTIVESLNVRRGIADFTIPNGVIARIGVPKAGRHISAISINGHPAWSKHHFIPCPGVERGRSQGHFIIFSGVHSGNYSLAIGYHGRASPFLHSPWRYSATALGQDRVTQGNWPGVYGRDGYVLFADGPGMKNIKHLPPYVKSVRCLWGHKTVWPGGNADPRALRTSAAGGAMGARSRRAGVFYSDLTSQAPQAAVDIRLRHRRSYRLALYAVDFDHQNRKETITIEDLATRQVIAPIQAFSKFANGAYMVFQCHGSVRIRFDPIRGGNAVLSGIFFDPPGG